MVRVSNVGRFAGDPELNLMDIDATGSMHGQVAFPVPGIGLVGHAIDSIGDVAIAVQLDRSLDHDFIVGYAANALLMWVYPLPRVQRADPVGIAVAARCGRRVPRRRHVHDPAGVVGTSYGARRGARPVGKPDTVSPRSGSECLARRLLYGSA